jgi:lipopolysaccharide export system protein LptC
MASGGALQRAAGRDAAYRAAMRHSRRVRFLKRVIPVAASLSVLFILYVMIFDPFRRLPAGLSISSIGLSGTKVVMDLPRLQGYRKDARPYEVTARSATQDIKSPNVVELKDLDANISLGAEGSARLRSPFGVLDSQKETLDLRESVRVTTDNGSIEADAMEIVDNGAALIFSGRVRSVLTPRDPGGQGAPDSAAPLQEVKQ